MIYLVKSTDKNGYKGKELILYPGFTSNLTIAQKYKEFKEERAESSVKYEIIPIPDKKFDELRSKDPVFYLCSEIGEVSKNIFITDDEYELIEQSLGEEIANLQYHFREVVKILKLFNDEDGKNLIRKIKKLSKKIEHDYEGEDFFASVDFERVIKHINL